MKLQKITYPEEFKGLYGKKYTLVKVYKHYGLYITETGYRVCFDINGIKKEMSRKRNI